MKKEATKPAAANFLQPQARFDKFIEVFNHERPHEALDMKCPAEVYQPSSRPYTGLPDIDYPCTLIFNAKPESMGGALARWVGISLISLGIACLPAKKVEAHGRAWLGLFLFNAGLAVVLAYFGATSPVHGFLLWPTVILHVVIAVMLLAPPASLRAAN